MRVAYTFGVEYDGEVYWACFEHMPSYRVRGSEPLEAVRNFLEAWQQGLADKWLRETLDGAALAREFGVELPNPKAVKEPS